MIVKTFAHPGRRIGEQCLLTGKFFKGETMAISLLVHKQGKGSFSGIGKGTGQRCIV
jgi:hypothetical protein